MCFQEYGQTWGTLSPLYNACMDECHDQFERCTQRPNPVRPKPGYARQFTYSWDQPSSDGVNGYYGYCGPTAASNLLANACGVMLPPRSLAEACFGIGPGTTPSALVGALNDIEGCGHWVIDHANASENDPLETLHRRRPVAVLLDWQGALDLHWITLVDVVRTGGSCHVVYNHWGRQDRMDCNEFVERWSLTTSTLERPRWRPER